MTSFHSYKTSFPRYSRIIKWLVFVSIFYGLFAWAAGEQRSWSFGVIGDSRNNDKVFCKLIGMIHDDPSHPELLLHTGDMVGACDEEKQWERFHKCINILGPKFPLYPAIGNHELKGGHQCRAIYIREARPPGGKAYYSFQHLNAFFISLDTEEDGHVNSIGPAQMDWLKTELEGRPKSDATFVFLHRPIFPVGVYRDQPLKNRHELHALFKADHVIAVFQGHEHMYARTEKDGVHYFHAAGGGAPLYKGYGGEFFYYLRVTISPGHVRVQAVDVDGKVRDDAEIAIKPPPAEKDKNKE